MRKRFLAFLFVLCLAGFGGSVAFGQTGQYVGASIGAPLLQGYYGLEDALSPDVDARIRLALGLFGGFSINVGADAIFNNLAILDDAGLLTLYAGVGPSVGFGGSSSSVAGVRYGYGYFSIDATGLVGVNYALNPNVSLFGETGLGLGASIVTSRAAGFPTTASAGGVYLPFRLALGATFAIQ